MIDPTQFVAIAGIGVQRLVEAFDPLLEKMERLAGPAVKKSIAIALSVIAGTAISLLAHEGFFFTEAPQNLSTLSRLGYATINGLLIGGGTEGFNSLVKILSSAKQASEKKAMGALPTNDLIAAARALPEPPTFAAGTSPP